jgi:hypothetical protein
MTQQPRTLVPFAVCFALLGPAIAIAQAQENTQQKPTPDATQTTAYQRATEVERESWRQTILHTTLPKKGCFVATFPETQWREMQCKPVPRHNSDRLWNQ